jgi:predicted DNA-binding transcriptional regulator AlpA
MPDATPQMKTEPLLTPDEVAAMIACPTSTLRGLRAVGKGPRYIRLGHKVIRYRRADIEDYIAACTK